MVNFEDGNTVARNKKELQELTTLQRRYQTINAIKEFKNRDYKDNTEDRYLLANIQSELISLFYEIDSTIEKDIQKKIKESIYNNLEEIESDIESDDTNRIFRAWNYINKLLYRLHLTKIDSQKNINYSDPEEVNEENDL